MRENGTLRYTTKKKAEVQLIFKIIFFRWIMKVNAYALQLQQHGKKRKKTSNGNTPFYVRDHYWLAKKSSFLDVQSMEVAFNTMLPPVYSVLYDIIIFFVFKLKISKE